MSLEPRVTDRKSDRDKKFGLIKLNIRYRYRYRWIPPSALGVNFVVVCICFLKVLSVSLRCGQNPHRIWWSGEILDSVSENQGSFLNLKFCFNICFGISIWDIETPVLPGKFKDQSLIHRQSDRHTRCWTHTQSCVRQCGCNNIQFTESRESVRRSPAGSRTYVFKRNTLKQCPQHSYTTSG